MAHNVWVEAGQRQPGAVARAMLLENQANRERFDAAMDLLDAGGDLVDATGRERLRLNAWTRSSVTARRKYSGRSLSPPHASSFCSLCA